MHNYTHTNEQSIHISINAIIREGRGRSGQVLNIIGKAICDTLPLADGNLGMVEALDYVEEKMKMKMDKVMRILPVDYLRGVELAERYYANRVALAYPIPRPASEKECQIWQVGGTTYLSKKQHKMWNMPDNQLLYLEFVSFFSEGETP